MAYLVAHTLFGHLRITKSSDPPIGTVKIARGSHKALIAAVVDHAYLNPSWVGFEVPGAANCYDKQKFQALVDQFRNKLMREKGIIGVYSPLHEPEAGAAA